MRSNLGIEDSIMSFTSVVLVFCMLAVGLISFKLGQRHEKKKNLGDTNVQTKTE